MISSQLRVLSFIFALLASPQGYGATPAFTKAMNEMEEIALKDPGPGFALWSLRALAVESGQFDEWHASLEARNTDPNAAVLLG